MIFGKEKEKDEINKLLKKYNKILIITEKILILNQAQTLFYNQ